MCKVRWSGHGLLVVSCIFSTSYLFSFHFDSNSIWELNSSTTIKQFHLLVMGLLASLNLTQFDSILGFPITPLVVQWVAVGIYISTISLAGYGLVVDIFGTTWCSGISYLYPFLWCFIFSRAIFFLCWWVGLPPFSLPTPLYLRLI